MKATLAAVASAILLALIFIPSKLKDSYYTQNPGGQEVSVAIVPHYAGANEQRAKFFISLAEKTRPKRIVIISTNHYEKGDGAVIAKQTDWALSNGTLKVDTEMLSYLQTNQLATANDLPYYDEHGVSNLLTDLYATYPDAAYTALLLKTNLTQAQSVDLAQKIKQQCASCLLISSIDFSHDNPISLAYNHDETSLKALANRDTDLAYSAETDSPQVMSVTTSWASASDAKYFHLSDHGNSLDNLSTEKEGVSYILGYYSQDQTEVYKIEKSTTFLFGGDIMLDRAVYHKFKSTSVKDAFKNLGSRLFWGSDIAIANLEGPISATAIDDDIRSDNLVFNFPPNSVDALKYLKLNSVSLANNHSGNAGGSGFANTQKVLAEANIKAIGNQYKFNSQSVQRYDTEITVSIITINMLEAPDQSAIVSAIKSETAAGYKVIMFPHWGNEYQTKHSASQKTLATNWITAGAKLIIGSHPHVIQDFEVINAVPVIYSLGNFVFDQYFSKETQQGLLIGGVIYQDQIKLSAYPISIIKSTPQLLRGTERQGLINTLFSGDPEHFQKTNYDDTIIIKEGSG